MRIRPLKDMGVPLSKHLLQAAQLLLQCWIETYYVLSELPMAQDCKESACNVET